jgi:3-hydroxyisobutyrate dehydrogenase/2-hydroxy-3-oxopropionate reductase
VVEAGVTVTRYDEADAPFVFTLTGGDVETVESVRALLDAYSTHSVHVGDLGSGMSLKIINNLVSLVQIIVAEEAFRLAAMTSVPAEILVDVMKRNGALTPVMETIARRTGEAPPERSVQMNREVQASNGIKDLALAEQLAKSVNTASSAATFAKSQYWFSMTAHGPTGAW